MVRVTFLEQRVALPAAWFLYARCCVLQNRGFEFLVFSRTSHSRAFPAEQQPHTSARRAVWSPTMARTRANGSWSNN